MIDLADGEAEKAFAALIPNFRVNARGQYRGPAAYRGGDNPTALSVDVTKGGRYFDHVAAEGGDVIAFAMKALECTFIEASGIISNIIGRNVLGGPAPRRRPRINDEELATAELFRIGLCWVIEPYLEALKELWALDELAPEGERIRMITKLLACVQTWPTLDIRNFMRKYRRVRPSFVASCIREANEMQMELAAAISHAPSGESAVA